MTEDMSGGTFINGNDGTGDGDRNHGFWVHEKKHRIAHPLEPGRVSQLDGNEMPSM